MAQSDEFVVELLNLLDSRGLRWFTDQTRLAWGWEGLDLVPDADAAESAGSSGRARVLLELLEAVLIPEIQAISALNRLWPDGFEFEGEGGAHDQSNRAPGEEASNGDDSVVFAIETLRVLVGQTRLRLEVPAGRGE